VRIPVWRWFLWGGLGATVVYFLLPDTVKVAAAASALFHYTSAAAVLVGVRWHRPADRWPWYLLAAALLALGSGDALLFVSPLGDLADLLFLAAYLALTVALLRLVRSRSRGRDLPALLDALVVTIGLGVVSWQVGCGAAALHPSMAVVAPPGAPVAHRRPRWRLALLGTAAILAPAVQILEWTRGRPIEVPVVAAGSIVMFLLIVARTQALTREITVQAERRRLLGQVADDRLMGELQGARGGAGGVEKGLGEETRVLRHLMSALRPPVLDNRGFAEALSEHAQRFEQENGIAVDIEIGLGHRLSPELETIPAGPGGSPARPSTSRWRPRSSTSSGSRTRWPCRPSPTSTTVSSRPWPVWARSWSTPAPTRPSTTRRWSPAPAARRSDASAPATCGMPSGSCGTPPGPGCSAWTA
jgi:hypothetical protein